MGRCAVDGAHLKDWMRPICVRVWKMTPKHQHQELYCTFSPSPFIDWILQACERQPTHQLLLAQLRILSLQLEHGCHDDCAGEYVRMLLLLLLSLVAL